MGYAEILLKMPTGYGQDELRKDIEKKLGIKDFSYQIDNKSLDSRNKNNIYWQLRVSVVSRELEGPAPVYPEPLDIPYRKSKKRAVVVGSGPAGFFSAFVLQKAGINTTIIERGSDVDTRTVAVRRFEHEGLFDSANNYAFGEGGAGTFSDGKLTSRSKHISREKQFVLSSYIQAGAPEEIEYMSHPHLGSDNLKNIVRNLRKEFLDIGGKIMFETLLEDLKVKNGNVTQALTTSGGLEAEHFILATGHSAYETYRMLMRKGVAFRTKNFAVGSRLEHPQELINIAQWGRSNLEGVKAAEYRLTFKGDGYLPVYTFCMCPGGTIVPAASYRNTNIVNGMSLYHRDGNFANAACVAAINLDSLLGREISPLEALDWLEALEESFYTYSNGYQAPFCTIRNFIDRAEPKEMSETSYSHGIKLAELWNLLPLKVSQSIREGLRDFSKKIKGFDAGNIMGLESKTSSPVQIVQDKEGFCCSFDNLSMAGEGSGYSGGIVSSAAHGIKVAMNIINKNSRSPK